MQLLEALLPTIITFAIISFIVIIFIKRVKPTKDITDTANDTENATLNKNDEYFYYYDN